MRAVWHGRVIAEADKSELIFIERNWYFPPHSVKQEYLKKSDTPYTCPWKGKCQYFDVNDGVALSKDAAWSYPDLLDSAIERVHKDFSNFVAFWHDVEIVES